MGTYAAKPIGKVDSFKNGLRTTIPFVAGIMLTLNAVGTCWSESLTRYPEDQAYRNSAVDFPLSPQSARKAFGPPESWMKWVDTGYEGAGGAYTGIQFQDQKRPYIFVGGEQSGIFKYIGPYTFICPGTVIRAQLGPENIYDSNGDRQILDSDGLEPSPASVTLKFNDRIFHCYALPYEWYTRVQIAPKFREKFAGIMDRLKLWCSKSGYRMLKGRGIVRCFKLRDDSLQDGFRYFIDVTEIGYFLGDGKIQFHTEENVRRLMMKFEVPSELKASWNGLSEEDVGYITDITIVGTYLILTDGRYLRKVN